MNRWRALCHRSLQKDVGSIIRVHGHSYTRNREFKSSIDLCDGKHGNLPGKLRWQKRSHQAVSGTNKNANQYSCCLLRCCIAAENGDETTWLSDSLFGDCTYFSSTMSYLPHRSRPLSFSQATAFARAYRPQAKLAAEGFREGLGCLGLHALVAAREFAQGTLNVDDTAPLGIISAKSGVEGSALLGPSRPGQVLVTRSETSWRPRASHRSSRSGLRSTRLSAKSRSYKRSHSYSGSKGEPGPAFCYFLLPLFVFADRQQ